MLLIHEFKGIHGQTASACSNQHLFTVLSLGTTTIIKVYPPYAIGDLLKSLKDKISSKEKIKNIFV